DEIEDIKKKLESTEIKGISIIDEAIEYASSLK
ncbi:MAG: hypothetical protein UY33_C0017G0045, partial [Candidatus Amesbacteria bacterium GW2011_GWA1_48_9]